MSELHEFEDSADFMANLDELSAKLDVNILGKAEDRDTIVDMVANVNIVASKMHGMFNEMTEDEFVIGRIITAAGCIEVLKRMGAKYREYEQMEREGF